MYCPKCGISTVKIEERAVAVGFKLALWWERFVAWLIDVVIIGAIAWMIRTLAVGFGGIGTSFNLVQGWPTWMPLFNLGLSEIFQFFYWMIMECTYGRSFGKMIMRLKVTRLDGSSLNMVQSAVQSVGKAFVLLIDVLLGWVLFSRKRQRIFNYLSGTVVVRSE